MRVTAGCGKNALPAVMFIGCAVGAVYLPGCRLAPLSAPLYKVHIYQISSFNIYIKKSIDGAAFLSYNLYKSPAKGLSAENKA